MAKESLALVGFGGSEVSGAAAGSSKAILQELQGLNVSLVTGGSANAKLTLAAIRTEDTIIAALNNNAGTITDIGGTMSIDDLRASGTVTIGTNLQAGDTITVNAKVYTAATTKEKQDFTKILIGADANATAVNLSAVINLREASPAGTQLVTASVATNVVTVRAVVEGTAANSYTLAQTGGRASVSGATLANGAAGGGVRSSGATNTVILFWYNKR